MKRFLWFLLGVAAATVAVLKGREFLRKATPAGVSDQVNKAGQEFAERASEFAETLSSAMQEREAELKAALGMDERATEAAR